MRRLLWALPFVLVGCGPTQTAKPVEPESLQTVSTKELSLSLPKHWKVVDLTLEDIEKAMANWDKEYLEKYKPIFEGLRTQPMYKTFAVDLDSTELNFSDNMSVVVLPAPGVTLEQLCKATESDLKALARAGTSPKSARAKYNGQEFGTSLTPLKGPQGASLVSYAYYTHHKDQSITITFTCLESHAGTFGEVVEQTMRTVKLQ
ncbi:MAG TPA: hypothetical protein PKA27_04275 [Fimbriimonadaceae bacterium]|nr:hypothetical protein [Fimbriimonadaceae bacterium]